jgi:hypothetical protein
METCVMCDGVGCSWCDNGVVPEAMLFVPPGDLKEKPPKQKKSAPKMVDRGDYQLIAFLRRVPGFHLVKSTNDRASSFTWCDQVGRIITVGDIEVPQCRACEKALAEDLLTQKQAIAKHRAEKQ